MNLVLPMKQAMNCMPVKNDYRIREWAYCILAYSFVLVLRCWLINKGKIFFVP